MQMKTRFGVAGLIALSLYLPASRAADTHGRYWIYGVGRQICSTYMEARKNGGIAEISYKNWVGGYLTAINQVQDDTYNIVGESDFQGAMVWLDSYCKKHPNNTITMAIANMTAVLYPRRRRAP